MRVNKGAAETAKTAEHVLFASQEEVTVQVTVFDPPQADGAEPPLLEMAALQPPVKLAEFNQVAYAASIADCVWQAACVLLVAQVSTTVGAVVTVKIAVHVLVSQVEVAVQVTVFEPPQAAGAEPPLWVRTAPGHPPLMVALFNQLVYAASIAD